MTIKLTTEHIRLVGIFERLIGVHVKDCLSDDDTVYFLIEKGSMGKAIGKDGKRIKNVSEALGKKVKVFEYADTPEKLINNLIPKANSIEIQDGVAIVSIPPNERSAVIGKGGKNIRIIKKFLERHFNIKNLRLK